jgi:hypothetical protein
MGTAASTVMAGAGPPSKPLFVREKSWMPTFVGMTGRHGWRVNVFAGWYEPPTSAAGNLRRKAPGGKADGAECIAFSELFEFDGNRSSETRCHSRFIPAYRLHLDLRTGPDIQAD